MFQILTFTEVHIASVTNRTEVHGDEKVPAVSIGLEMTAANTILDQIDPKLREALYKAVDGQDQLPGVEPSTPVLRCNCIDRAVLPTSHEGWTLQVDDGIDESVPMTFGSVKCDKFSVEPKQGGTIVLRLRCGTSDISAETLGKLAMHNGQSIWVKLTAPNPKADAIDGTTDAFDRDHPDATDLFTAGWPNDPDGADSEGGDMDIEALARADADGPWPFQKDAPDEAPPESTTTESPTRSPAGSRTARGRERTKAALAAGKAVAEQVCEGTHADVLDDTQRVLAGAGLLNGEDGSLNWQALKDREPKQQTWEEAVRECISDPAEVERLLALNDDAPVDAGPTFVADPREEKPS